MRRLRPGNAHEGYSLEKRRFARESPLLSRLITQERRPLKPDLNSTSDCNDAPSGQVTRRAKAWKSLRRIQPGNAHEGYSLEKRGFARESPLLSRLITQERRPLKSDLNSPREWLKPFRKIVERNPPRSEVRSEVGN
jgi:hypothetical protein